MSRQDWNDPRSPATGGARVVGAVVGFAFAGIGVTVLIFLWGAPFGDFGSPPLFFRIFGSFIAIVFVAVGGIGAIASLRARPMFSPPVSAPAPGPQAPQAAGGYRCPHCGAPLGEKVDVSPSGDVKCQFCGRWFNIHRAGVQP